jgi:hypothetical protein
MERHAEGAQIVGQHLGRKIRLLLVEVDRRSIRKSTGAERLRDSRMSSSVVRILAA